MVFGRAHKITDPAEKEMRLRNFTERLFPGRWDILRPATPKELKATTMLGLSLDEASAKVRTGPPGGDKEYQPVAWIDLVLDPAAVLQYHRPAEFPQTPPSPLANLCRSAA